jgi:hypothetical protein
MDEYALVQRSAYKGPTRLSDAPDAIAIGVGKATRKAAASLGPPGTKTVQHRRIAAQCDITYL